jgi:hypothetical protein
MFSFEDLKIYLPKYLSPESEKSLFDELRQFPENIDDRLYLSPQYVKPDIVYQGDGIHGLLVVNLPETDIKKAPGMIFSNTCDIDERNKRLFPSTLVYSPLFNLEKYKNGLIESKIKDPRSIEDHISLIRKQKIAQIFYLPKGGALANESIVFFNRVNSCDSTFLEREKIKDMRLFTLSNYGLYLFIFKLSVHFTRITESIDRSSRSALS